MKLWNRLKFGVRAFFSRGAMRRDLEEEISGVLAIAIDEKIAEGIAPDEARRKAILELGNPGRIIEDCHDEWGIRWLDDLLKDCRSGARKLVKSPKFTCTAIVSLGLCFGANLTIFAVIDAIVFSDLPIPEPDRLVEVTNVYPEASIVRGGASIANYFDRREQIKAFESVSLYSEFPMIIGDSESSFKHQGARVTPEFFQTLGVPLAMGTTFTDAELDYGSDFVAVITDRYWRNHFAADPNVLGQTLKLHSFDYDVIGVLPPEFQFLSSQAQIYTPLSHRREKRFPDNRHADDAQMIARLAEGRTIAEAEAELRVINFQLVSDDPLAVRVKDSGYHTRVLSLHQEHIRSIKPVLTLLQTGVLFLLMIGAINLTGLLLIHAIGSRKEIAVRKALGAKPSHFVRKTLVETLLLTISGGALGLMVGGIGVWLVKYQGATLLPLGANIGFDGRVILVSIGASILLGLLIAIPVILLILRDNTQVDLQGECRGATASRFVQFLRHSFVVSQIAMAFVLLCGAGLLAVSLERALEESPGFESEEVLTAELVIVSAIYNGANSVQELVDHLLGELRLLPEVKAAAITSGLPFTVEGSGAKTIYPEAWDASSGASLPAHRISIVSSDYWKVLDIPLLRGRYLVDSDSRSPTRVAVIDQVLADRHWPDGDAIGSRFSTTDHSSIDKQIFGAQGAEFVESDSYTIVGIVGSVKQVDLTEQQALGAVYLPFQHLNKIQLIIRGGAEVSGLAPRIEKIVRQIDPGLPIDNFKTMQMRIDDSLISRRVPTILACVFAGMALLLTGIGIYGTLSFAVSQRRGEIGVRMAIGAMRRQIGGQFLLTGLRLYAVGGLLGLLGAIFLGQVMQSVLYEVSSWHLATLMGAAAILGLVTLLACLIPANRASQIDPIAALRAE